MPVYPKNLAEGWLFIKIWFLITILSPLIRWCKMPHILRLLSPGKVTPGRWSADKIVSFTDTILERERFIYRRNCLKRSLSLYYFLNRIDIPVRINLGVKRGGKGLEGHGWLTLDGELYKEPNAGTPSYQVIYSYP